MPEYESQNTNEKIVVNIPIKDIKKLSPETSRLINRGKYIQIHKIGKIIKNILPTLRLRPG